MCVCALCVHSVIVQFFLFILSFPPQSIWSSFYLFLRSQSSVARKIIDNRDSVVGSSGLLYCAYMTTISVCVSVCRHSKSFIRNTLCYHYDDEDRMLGSIDRLLK